MALEIYGSTLALDAVIHEHGRGERGTLARVLKRHLSEVAPGDTRVPGELTDRRKLDVAGWRLPVDPIGGSAPSVRVPEIFQGRIRALIDGRRRQFRRRLGLHSDAG